MDKKWITTTEASDIASVNIMTMVLWCKKYKKLGIKVGGRWRVDPEILEEILNGTYYEENCVGTKK